VTVLYTSVILLEDTGKFLYISPWAECPTDAKSVQMRTVLRDRSAAEKWPSLGTHPELEMAVGGILVTKQSLLLNLLPI